MEHLDSMEKRHIGITGLRRRWLINSMTPIFAVTLLVAAVICAGIANYYYNMMRDGLQTRATHASDYFTSYTMNSYLEFYQNAVSYAEGFAEKDRLELQFISTSGKVIVSSYSTGLTSGMSPGTPDITGALQDGKVTPYRGVDPLTGQHIMSVSAPLQFNGQVEGVMRYVTAMSSVQREILMVCGIAAALLLLCMVMTVIANMVFINNVVEPVAVVTDAAKRISAGSYGIRIENKYPDELGELVDNINDMSLKIGRNEKMKQEFISSVSHELRTPVSVIRAQCEYTLERDRSPEEYREALEVIFRQSRRMTRLVEDMLSFTRLERRAEGCAAEPVDLSALVRSACEDLALIREKNITLTCEAADGVVVEGDRALLGRLLTNLVGNAYRYGRENGYIRVKVERADGCVLLSVEDNGVGIAPEQQEKVFNRFYQADAARSGEGTGLGLAMAREIARLHGGDIRVTSEPGKGSIFVFGMPEKNSAL